MCSILYKLKFIYDIANAAETVFRVPISGQEEKGKISAGNMKRIRGLSSQTLLL
jgi:hypothetical protein